MPANTEARPLTIWKCSLDRWIQIWTVYLTSWKERKGKQCYSHYVILSIKYSGGSVIICGYFSVQGVGDICFINWYNGE